MTIRDEVLEILNANFSELTKRFGVRELCLFGSVSRGEDTDVSDIDLLYRFEPDAETYHNLFALHEYLEELFGRKVDLVSAEWCGARFLSLALKDAISCGVSDDT